MFFKASLHFDTFSVLAFLYDKNTSNVFRRFNSYLYSILKLDRSKIKIEDFYKMRTYFDIANLILKFKKRNQCCITKQNIIFYYRAFGQTV